jgi:hypothetical protein
MKQLISILICLFFSISAFATEQEADLLIVNNDTIYLKSFPLDRLNLTERPFGYTTQTATSTACQRGYRAIWRIVDNKLYLEKITRCYSDKKEGEESLTELFKRNQIDFKEKDKMILADWVTIDLYTMNFSIARHYPNRIYLYDGYHAKGKMKEKNLRLRIVDGKIEVEKLKK